MDVAALLIEYGGDACGSPVRMRQYFITHITITHKPPLLGTPEQLKTAGQLQVE